MVLYTRSLITKIQQQPESPSRKAMQDLCSVTLSILRQKDGYRQKQLPAIRDSSRAELQAETWVKHRTDSQAEHQVERHRKLHLY